MNKCKDCKNFFTYIVNTLDRITEGLKKTYRSLFMGKVKYEEIKKMIDVLKGVNNEV